ncbi:hypothetical protein LAZ67_3005997 [Cordylochernes scorpioides]|uniref:Transposase n=1 Tax=Cordylochernes scorpioides TaxID=51811 RepID=A0ABY6KFJ1_9ARAC|nr:hypothetical protein LAZ67_3005997 [Cordylochernes scorpioides]
MAFAMEIVKIKKSSSLLGDEKGLSVLLAVVSSSLLTNLTRSPDLSPIEHIWDVMGRRLPPSRNVDYLARQLETIWQEIPQHTIRNLYQSMTRRVAACIQASGGPTTY